MKDKPDFLEEQIITVLNNAVEELHANGIQGDDSWTRKFKERLAELGESLGCKICTSGFKDIYNNEWLFDMVWYKENEKQQLVDVPLVVESEWRKSLKHIKFD